MELVLIKIVHRLRIARGTNAKLAILKEHKNNEIWKKFLVYTYDQRMTFGVSAPVSPDFDEVPISERMFSELDNLANREVTGNQAKQLARILSTSYGEIPRLILGRSIKAGVSFTTINKAYPGLIVVFESMKGKDCRITEWPVASSIKYDGGKVFAFVSENEVFLTSSSGSEITIKKLISEMRSFSPGVYEGELIHKEGKMVDRTVINGKITSLVSGTIDDLPDSFDWSYMIYDYIPTEEWANKHGKMPFRDRYGALMAMFNVEHPNLKYVKQVIQNQLDTIDAVVRFYNYYSSLGYEGSMHRYIYDTYRWNRSDRLVKKKAIRECVLRCVSVIPHTNPSKGNIGSLTCMGAIRDKDAGSVQVKVNVGSGLSKYDIQFDEDRYIDRDIEVIYNSVTKTDKGYSLFLPRYKRIVGDP